jgi:heptosyltransferase-3
MAAAFGLPVIVLFGPSDPIVWAPWKTESAVLASKADPIESISVSAVLNALANLSVGQVQ